MPAKLDVCIRGAGIVGRTLALLLARERLRVGLVDRARTPDANDVRAYALNHASKDLLESMRAWPQPQHATPVLAMQVQGDEGSQVNFSAPAPDVQALAWIADVAALTDQLAQALRYQPLVTLLNDPEPAALTVICEGGASATREEFGVTFDVTPYGQHAVAARLDCEKSHEQIARQWFSGGEIMAFLPLGGPGGNSVALVWSVGQERAGQLLALPPAQFEQAVQSASAQSLGQLRLTSERAAWPLQLARAVKWCGPGWVLAGDAAHTVHPLAGQGLNLGLADARELAGVLRGREYWRGLGDERLLRRYERARKADVLAMSAATDSLQLLFARPEQPLNWLRNRGMEIFERSGPFKAWVVRQAAGRL